MRPGVTGLAQVQRPADSDVTSVRRKLAYDLFYIRRLSPWLDLRLLLCTPLYALGISHERLRCWFGIPQTEEIEQTMQADVFEGGADSRSSRRSA